jgi:large subunit ribosomal protein L28
MSKVCEICGKGRTIGNLVSHSNIKTKRSIYPNLQYKKIDGQRMKVCTSCIKTQTKKVK